MPKLSDEELAESVIIIREGTPAGALRIMRTISDLSYSHGRVDQAHATLADIDRLKTAQTEPAPPAEPTPEPPPMPEPPPAEPPTEPPPTVN